ncbi:MAG: Na+/H+ antiporter subunit E [Pseudomonadota bacterium]
MRLVVLAVLLAGFWLALSGLLKPLLIVVGVLSILLCLWCAHRMRTIDDEGMPLQVIPGAITYLPWLTWEIIKSAWKVTQIIIDPRLPISPTMTVVRASQKTDVGVNVYANSITLTPGTVTTNCTESRLLTVHAIVSENADDVESGEMDRRVTRFEGA